MLWIPGLLLLLMLAVQLQSELVAVAGIPLLLLVYWRVVGRADKMKT
jgi:hypothetical protein